MNNFDLIVIGSGPGGYVAAIRASQLGMKVAVVEKESLGGVCLNWGCIPTKALLKSAQVFDYLNHAKDYGIEVAETKANFPEVIKRSRSVAEGMSKGVQFLMKKNNIEVIYGYGKVLPGKRVEVTLTEGGIKIYKANNVLLATGGRAKQLFSLPIDGKKIIDYRKAMVLPELPKNMVIVGAGAIGVEFAYFYQTMGTQVTLIEFFDTILPLEDKEVGKTLEKIYTKKGMTILTSSKVLSTKIDNEKVQLLVNTKTGEQVIETDIVLSAAGVVANIENIGLELCGIQTENDKVKVNAFYQTNVEGVYAIGDIVKGQALAHVASAEGIIAVEHMANHHPQPLDYDNIPGCTYCSPEVASVGITEQKAKEKGLDILVGKFPFSASGKAKAAGKSDGFVKLIIDKKYGEVLGAHFIGENVTEMIAEIIVARKLETTGMQILKSVHPHPTMSEAIMEAAAAAYGEVIHL
ncbi:MAG: dihydrolipoyl dehydrogenase [Sphingobacteriales bacterium]|nr:dihydrolipoyl dehydrogenase [Sphingobacteriales bacterium]